MKNNNRDTIWQVKLVENFDCSMLFRRRLCKRFVLSCAGREEEKRRRKEEKEDERKIFIFRIMLKNVVGGLGRKKSVSTEKEKKHNLWRKAKPESGKIIIRMKKLSKKQKNDRFDMLLGGKASSPKFPIFSPRPWCLTCWSKQR